MFATGRMRPRRKWINEKNDRRFSLQKMAEKKISHQQEAMKRRILWQAQLAHMDLFTKNIPAVFRHRPEAARPSSSTRKSEIYNNEERRTLKRRDHSNLLRKRRPVSSSKKSHPHFALIWIEFVQKNTQQEFPVVLTTTGEPLRAR